MVDDLTPAAGDDAVIAPLPSTYWQPDASAVHRRALTDYLDTAAAMDAVQTAAARAVAALRLRPGSTVLDVGCGAGASLELLAAAAGSTGRVVGLDHAPALLDEAWDRIANSPHRPRIRLETGDALRLPFPGASFDAVHFSRVLIHVADPDRALQEARRVTKPGGWIVAIEPDFLGMRLDLPDVEAARLLVAGQAATVRHPAMGLELFRRFGDAGLVERTVTAVTEFERRLEPAAIPYYRRAAEVAVKRGWLDQPRAETALAALIDAGDRDRFASYSSLIVTAGRAPAS